MQSSCSLLMVLGIPNFRGEGWVMSIATHHGVRTCCSCPVHVRTRVDLQLTFRDCIDAAVKVVEALALSTPDEVDTMKDRAVDAVEWLLGLLDEEGDRMLVIRGIDAIAAGVAWQLPTATKVEEVTTVLKGVRPGVWVRQEGEDGLKLVQVGDNLIMRPLPGMPTICIQQGLQPVCICLLKGVGHEQKGKVWGWGQFFYKGPHDELLLQEPIVQFEFEHWAPGGIIDTLIPEQGQKEEILSSLAQAAIPERVLRRLKESEGGLRWEGYDRLA